MVNNELVRVVGIISLVMSILNIVFLVIIFFIRRRMAVVSQWPSTLGSVTASYLERRASGKNGSTNYPVVHYAYQVGRQPYQGRKIAPGPEVGGSGAAKVVARYPVGAQVMVFYNPQDPADAVLERKAPAQWLFLLILVIFDVTFCTLIPVIFLAINP